MPELEEYAGVKIGTWADTVLELLGTPSDIRNLGNNADSEVGGYVVEWSYHDEAVRFTIARGIVDDLYYGRLNVYAVQKIEAI